MTSITRVDLDWSRRNCKRPTKPVLTSEELASLSSKILERLANICGKSYSIFSLQMERPKGTWENTSATVDSDKLPSAGNPPGAWASEDCWANPGSLWALHYILHFFNSLIPRLPFSSRSRIPSLPESLSGDNVLCCFVLCVFCFLNLNSNSFPSVHCLEFCLADFLLLSPTGERQGSCVSGGCHFRVNYTPQCYRLRKINSIPNTKSFELI